MTLQIELKPEVEASLVAQAAAKGVSLPEYVQELLEDSLPAYNSRSSKTPEAQVQALIDWSERLPYHRIEPLSAESLTRENLYGADE